MLTGILIVLVALALLLLIPVTLAFRIDWPERRNQDIRVIWAFGLVNVRVSESDANDDDDERAPEAEDEDDDEDAKGSSKPLAAIRYKPFRQRMYRLVRELWRAIGKDDVFLRIRVGLDNPADTGQLWAWLGPLSAFVSHARDAEVSLQPEFRFEQLDVDAGGRIRIVPLQILGLALGLALSREFWRGLRLARARA